MPHASTPPTIPSARIRRSRRTPALTGAEWALLLALGLALALAVGLPASALPVGYHHFADQRGWGALPHAADVLSNAPFALAAAWLWRQQARAMRSARDMNLSIQPSINADERQNTHTAHTFLYTVMLGLLTTTVGSAIYHWAPGDAGLAVDRLGMSLAFAGVLSLAVAERVSARAGQHLVLPLLLASAAAALWAWHSGNMTPWAVVQGLGLLLLVVLAWCRPLPGTLDVRWLWVVLAYAAAKALELGDHAVFEATQGWVAGHALKHGMAALAVLPIGLALRRLHRAAQPN